MSTKLELVNIINELRADVENAKTGADSSYRAMTKANESLDKEKKKSQGFSNQLSDVRKAIQTVLKMKYPDRNINGSNDMSMMVKAETAEVPVNEELNLLHYLMDLTQPPMTTNDFMERYQQ